MTKYWRPLSLTWEKFFFRETDPQSLSSLVLAALSKINEAIESKNPDNILTSLGSPSAKLTNVRPKNAELYAIILKQAKEEKAKVFSFHILKLNLFWTIQFLFLTYFSQVLQFYTSWKHQKTKGFLTFSGGVEMEYWAKMD